MRVMFAAIFGIPFSGEGDTFRGLNIGAQIVKTESALKVTVSVVSGSDVNNILHYDAAFLAPFLVVIESIQSS